MKAEDIILKIKSNYEVIGKQHEALRDFKIVDHVENISDGLIGFFFGVDPTKKNKWGKPRGSVAVYFNKDTLEIDACKAYIRIDEKGNKVCKNIEYDGIRWKEK
tara:strand:- start:9377 stop:9688 length:312 start_codon:yes stop_codon:yes gene_type:complete